MKKKKDKRVYSVGKKVKFDKYHMFTHAFLNQFQQLRVEEYKITKSFH